MKENNQELAEKLIKEHEIVALAKTSRPAVRLYSPQTGIYDGNDATVYGVVYKELGHTGTTRRIEDIVTHIRRMSPYVSPDVWNRPGLIVFENGVLDTDSMRFEPGFRPLDRMTLRIPWRYRPEAECPVFDKAFAEILPSEDGRAAVREFFGYCLVPENWYQRAMIFLGSGRNGKSTVIKVLENMLGASNVSNLSLHDLANNRFAAANLVDKLLNVFADVDARVLEKSGRIKSVIGGDALTVEQKGRDHFETKLFTRMLFSANEMPPSLDTTDAWLRRLHFIEFNQKFEGENADTSLETKLKVRPEIEGVIARHALPGLRKMKEQRGITIAESSIRLLAVYRKEIDSVLAFLNESCQVTPNVGCTRIELFDAYVKFCGDNRFKHMGKLRFAERLKELQEGLDDNAQIAGQKGWTGIVPTPPELVN